MASIKPKFRPTDPGFSEWARTVLETIESDFSGDEGDCVLSDYASDHESCSEQDASDEELVAASVPVEAEKNGVETDKGEKIGDDEEPLPKKKKHDISESYYGKNRFKWSANPPQSRTRTKQHNIISHLPGIIGPAKQLGTYCSHRSAWELLFTDEILEEILLRTNEKLAEVRQKLSDRNKHEYKDLNLPELKAFLGILMYSAVFKSNNEDLEALFATDGTGRDIFRSTISLRRVQTLLSCLRFDNAADRNERKKSDATAAISWVFQKFIENCQQCYSIGEYACIDEMLVGFRGRCKFRMYMPNKPRKYGIKVMALNDAKTHYFLNGYIYSGKDSDGIGLSDVVKKMAKPTQSVLRLAAPICHTNRNITADNWFTSIELVSELLKRGLTYVGTMKKNKREVPKEFLPSKVKVEKTAMYGFTKDLSLVSFVPKKNKAVLLVSSMHHTRSIDDKSERPEIVEFYNATKGGVDALDEKCEVYSTGRRTNRWPMAIFFQLLNISLVNSYVIFSAFRENPVQKRIDFIKNLARSLVEPQLNTRLMNGHLPRELRETIGRILGKQVPVEENKTQGVKVRCSMCPRSKDKKTKTRCVMCQAAICKACTRTVCEECLK